MVKYVISLITKRYLEKSRKIQRLEICTTAGVDSWITVTLCFRQK